VDRDQRERTTRPTAFSVARRISSAELYLSGELDLASCAATSEAIDELIDEGCRLLTVSLDRVTFMDASGIGALVRGQRRLEAVGGTFALSCESPQPRRLLRLTGMEQVFHLRRGQGRVQAVPPLQMGH
jgi:anti-sigma B factor antagonist